MRSVMLNAVRTMRKVKFATTSQVKLLRSEVSANAEVKFAAVRQVAVGH